MNNDNKQATEDLKSVLNFGLSIQSVAVVVEFCAKHNKTDFLNKLKEEMANLMNSLTDEEKQELQKDMESMIAKKAEEFVEELSKNLTSEEADKVVKSLQ